MKESSTCFIGGLLLMAAPSEAGKVLGSFVLVLGLTYWWIDTRQYF